MTIRQLMLELSKFDGSLEVIVATPSPSKLLDIEAVETTDPETETHVVMLKCKEPSEP